MLTSPPYAGVYDYLSHARGERARLCARGRGGVGVGGGGGGGGDGGGDGGGNDGGNGGDGGDGDSGDGGSGDGGSGRAGGGTAPLVMGVRGTPGARGEHDEWPEAWS